MSHTFTRDPRSPESTGHNRRCSRDALLRRRGPGGRTLILLENRTMQDALRQHCRPFEEPHPCLAAEWGGTGQLQPPEGPGMRSVLVAFLFALVAALLVVLTGAVLCGR